ncbi:hypothetical protein VTK73DRAFT_4397 [Phialemonium thermophilum]|uniref:Uncharacterized protein n=1 Tax=Phialemonium thermophilum TaxID=223376 RepID=A0ABR3WTJ5_9PEZI
MAAQTSTKPQVGDILLVIHDFQARSSDELSLEKGDRVELIETDDEFGDGWFLGKHLANGNSGLFPEVYTRPAPKLSTSGSNPLSASKHGLATVVEAANEPKSENSKLRGQESQLASPSFASSVPPETSPSVTLPLSSFKSTTVTSPPLSDKPVLPAPSFGSASLAHNLDLSQDSHVLHETLNVINEHITDLSSTQATEGLRPVGNDSESEYSSQMDHRLSYIQGEETDEEEENTHTRAEVLAWSSDDVAEYLFTVGVEKKHCEVFRDQEITGEVLLGMDQTSLFIKAFDLGSVGRRLKTWQKIKALQDEVNGESPSTRRTTQTYESETGSDAAGRVRSRTSTLTSSVQRLPPLENRPDSAQTRRVSVSQTPRMDPVSPLTPVSPLVDSPSRPLHEKRPSAASVRDLHHSRRHSSTDFRLGGANLDSTGVPKLSSSGTFPQSSTAHHKKEPSFDRNWTLRNATAHSQRPLSSAGFPSGVSAVADLTLEDSAIDVDRGYFSGPDGDPRRRSLLRKREVDLPTQHSRKSSYAEEQRVRTATALSRHSRFGSVDSVRDSVSGPTSAAQKYYGLGAAPHRRTASSATTESIRPVPPAKDGPAPTVTVLDGAGLPVVRSTPSSALLPSGRPAMHGESGSRSGFRGGFRAISDAVTGHERSKLTSPADLPYKASPIQSPARTGSSTPSGGRSFELDSPDAVKSPSTGTTTASRNSRKTKKETSAYLRGLQKITPREAMADADYSGWMKKKSSNLMTTWKPRLFVLKGRRLAYYYSEDDEQEKGLIDISFHRVLPADNERITGLHATLTGASNTPAVPAGSHVPTLADADSNADPTKESDAMFIFKLVPPRTGLSRAVNFTKPTVHYFAVPNLKQGRLWMAALMKATIDRDDSQPITTTYQQKTISLARARAMRHRPPNLMNLDEVGEEAVGGKNGEPQKESNGLGIVYDDDHDGKEPSGLEKLGLQKVESAKARAFSKDTGKESSHLPQSA